MIKHILIGNTLALSLFGYCAEEPVAPPAPGPKIEMKLSPEGDAIVFTVDGQEKLRIYANSANMLLLDVINNGDNFFFGHSELYSVALSGSAPVLFPLFTSFKYLPRAIDVRREDLP